MTKTVVSGHACRHFTGHHPPMRFVSFGELAQQLIDVWISREVQRPAILSHLVGEQLSANMALAVIEVADSGPTEFGVNLVRDYSIPTSYADVPDVLKSRLPLVPGGHLHPSIQKAIAGRRPSLVSETVCHDNMQTNFEMLSLPRKTEQSGGDWCLVFGVVNYILRPSAIPKDLDGIDLAILQLLREGLQMREIGHRVELSPRTVEHRIERLKALTGARTLHDLVARSI
ncbi:winged helix-turn-helix transcriptional regulator [Rhizobium ruizarguesonis]|nr:winged helix-turn-helix transcriptional regulator [Rhizobium ruizarguesonis]TAX14430.1 winged helix-turn-helix transcriptional regulator [Rhizobium ruizarguesonis]TAX19261.1 winged helix-turn-helix transcriptional regulator [Rhizobium ruizarguesonis]